MEKADIYKHMQDEMGYKESPDNVCVNCTSSEIGEFHSLECALNPIYKFETQPGATCAWWSSKENKDSLSNLNR